MKLSLPCSFNPRIPQTALEGGVGLRVSVQAVVEAVVEDEVAELVVVVESVVVVVVVPQLTASM